ncbi:hypothetical protein [Anaeromyxobacter sp. PSR-1]|uniref:hypothetical protein n=1 Tax=unclassified Anaeromyxobacter TaxID=2620896 RepID=UPI0005E1F44C|nr:hypothetical protein [Anaeromyxobacter sp. PSR-1]GAO03308.1 hypothetical protein PSR1_02191 [Anaeromyxobacter sp. PSR-1]
MNLRRLAAAAALAAAMPSLAYVLHTSAVLRRMGEKRASLSLSSLEVTGTLQVEGPAAERLAASAGLPRSATGEVSAPARFLMKVPGRCRLELAPAGVAEAQRPAVSLARDGRLGGRGGLDQVPAAAALVRAACALLAAPTAGDASGAYAAALSRRGVAVSEIGLGRFDGHLAYVIGGRSREGRPVAFVDKEAFQPLRLVAAEGGALQDVRLLGWGSPAGGDWFPRAVEVAEQDALRLRFTTERAHANPALPDAGW